MIIRFLLVFFLSSLAYADNYLTIDFFDVGEGDAALISGKDLESTLIDCGNLFSGPKLVKELKANGFDIKNIILSHHHLDHLGGIFSLLAEFPNIKIFDNGETLSSNEDTYRWFKEFIRSSNNYQVITQGNHVSIGKIKLKIISPPNPRISRDWNTNSLVILLEHENFKVLFMGDANIATEKYLVDKKLLSKVAILKAGHHGAADTGSKEFIKIVKPEVVIVSNNKNNIRSYPALKTINKYKKFGAKVYNTAQHGTIKLLVSENGKYNILTQK